MIEVKNLTKKYGSNTAVKNLSFTIEKGKIYGLLGPNGAGKSTTMNIITGCLSATSGTVLVDGHDIFEEPLEAKKHIGYLPEIPPLYTEMTAKEYLNFVAEAKNVPFDKRQRSVKEVMKLTNITDISDRLIMNLSKGYKQRVGIAQALLGDPEVVILDEPTVGLDPKQIIEIRDLIRDLGKIKTVVISSHILAEISAVCDHVIIISKGNLVANDSLAELENNATKANGITIKVRASENDTNNILKTIGNVEIRDISQSGGITTAVIALKGERDLRDEIFFAFANAHKAIIEMFTKESTLEDIFMDLTSSGYVPSDKSDDASDDAGDNGDSAETVEEEAEEDSKEEAEEKDEDDYKPLFGGNSDEE